MPHVPPFITRRSFEGESSSKKASTVGLFHVAGGLIIIIGLAFSAGAFFLRAFQERQIEALRDRLAVLIDELDPVTVRAMDVFDKKLALASNLLDEHASPSKIFAFLAQTTLKDARFNSFAFSAKEYTVALTTEAKGYSALINQLNLFRAQPSVETMEVGSISLGPGGEVRTSITLKVVPTLLR